MELGVNENMNGLIKQYIPKGIDFSGIADEFVAWLENKWNKISGKKLGYFTPNEDFILLLTNWNSIAFVSRIRQMKYGTKIK